MRAAERFSPHSFGREGLFCAVSGRMHSYVLEFRSDSKRWDWVFIGFRTQRDPALIGETPSGIL